MTPRIYLDRPLQPGAAVTLPAAQSRHAQVLRLQPGDRLVLFNGGGGEWQAGITRMGRTEVDVRVEAHDEIERELPRAITLALGMPANDRMDALVEKATELGVAAIQPLVCERSVLRLEGERAEKRRLHWQGIAIAAAEQSGRTRVPRIAPVQALPEWLQALASGPRGNAGEAAVRCLLSLDSTNAIDGGALLRSPAPLVCLSGPEGGLTPDEEAAALRCGFVAVSLGPRVLRADTAPLALLAGCGLAAGEG